MMRIFVYGTLMKGFHNHYLLEERDPDGARFVGEATVEGDLIDLGGCPALIPGARAVKGEVYEVQNPRILARLDRLEGHPIVYERVKVTLREGGEAEAYFGKADWMRHSPIIPSGSWRALVEAL